MPKKRTKSTNTENAKSSGSGPSQNKAVQLPKAPEATPHPVFPPLRSKDHLTCNTLEPDQIITIPDVFNVEECKQFIGFMEKLPLELTPPPKRGEAVRVNQRTSLLSTGFANTLFRLLSPHLPAFPSPSNPVGRPPSAFNSNIRLYKYTEGQYFGCHYDDSVRDPAFPGMHTEWTLLIYLSGLEDGVVGGETVFYKGMGKRKTEIRPELHRGMALLHKHGQHCMLHEGAPVLKGTKYVLRSDLLFLD